MFNNSNGYSLADIAAATGNKNDDNFGFGNAGGVWIFFLFIIFMMWGWNGNNGFGNNGAAQVGANVTADVQRGFDQSALINGLSNLTTVASNGFANAEVSRCNSQANILQTLNNNQNNLSNQLNTIAMNQQNCCCENRAAVADLKYTVATEACADRNAVSSALKEVLIANTANTQLILDKMCQQEIDALKAQNQQLQMQNYLASLAASQNAQTGQILNDNAAQTATVLRTLNPSAVPAYIVSNPNGCNCRNYYGCGQ